MSDAVPAAYLVRDGERWTAAELDRLRREYPAAVRRRTVAALAASLGRTPHALTNMAQHARCAGWRRLSPARLGRLRALLEAGTTYRAAARALRVDARTVLAHARRLGLATTWDDHAPRPDRGPRIAARLRGLAAGRECDSWSEYQRLTRVRRYMALGYPPGISSERQRAVFDAARRRGGLTGPECEATLSPGARLALRDLCAVGALERHGGAGSTVATRKAVAVYRVARAWLDRVPRRSAGA